MENKLEPIPEVGKYYHFFDDGKLSPSRHYICRVERLLSKEEANDIMVEVPYWNIITNEDETVTITLLESEKEFNILKRELTGKYWLADNVSDSYVHGMSMTKRLRETKYAGNQ